MLLYLGPVIFGFLIGFILGTRIKSNPESNINFTLGSYLVVFIIAIIVAWQLGPFPYYDDIPIATGFLSGAIGLIIGKLLLGR
ncbi:MAG: energy-converting hydrogenase B subunit J [Methanobrevibacter sp.]|jgi:energy-converting hydrogenase B subunit J|nr:energy-converting hydrogenase B subunit J [Methanobrevibacter sp.]